jgi:hypothetical protein
MFSFHCLARRSRYSIISGILYCVSMCSSGNGTCPKKALRVSHSSTVLSLPIDQSITSCLNSRYASRRM